MLYNDPGARLARAEDLTGALCGKAEAKQSKRGEQALVPTGEDAHLGNCQQSRGRHAQMHSSTTRGSATQGWSLGPDADLHFAQHHAQAGLRPQAGLARPPSPEPPALGQAALPAESWTDGGSDASDCGCGRDETSCEATRETQARRILTPVSGSGTMRTALPGDRLGCCCGRTLSADCERSNFMGSTVARSGRAARYYSRKELSERRAGQATRLRYMSRQYHSKRGTTAFRRDTDHLSAANSDVSARRVRGMESGQCHTRNRP